MKKYICIPLDFFGFEWYEHSETKALFIHLLLIANEPPRRLQGTELGSGQVVVCHKSLSFHTGLSVNAIRASLAQLHHTGEISFEEEWMTSISTSKQIITICDYEKYQTGRCDNDDFLIGYNDDSVEEKLNEEPV